jgi:DNA-binding response OmpR family regulator
MPSTLLLVIDDDSLRDALASRLEAEGFTVIVETESEWALETFARRPIDLVILGTHGGDSGGLELAEQIRRSDKGRRIPLLMIGEAPRKASILQAARRAYRPVDLIEAPVEPGRVLAALRRELGAAYPQPEREPQQPAADDEPAERYADPQSRREQTEVEAHTGLFRAAPRHGSITERPFPELLGDLYRERASGAMLIQRDRTKKLIALRDGVPTQIKSNRLEECLGRFLVRARMIDEDECRASLEKMKASGRQQGAVLVSMGCLSPTSLRRALELQLQMKLYEPFGWSRGSYRFDPRIRPAPAAVPLTISTATAILRGVRRRMSVERIEARLADRLDRAPMPHPDPRLRFQALELDGEDRDRLERIYATRRLADLLTAPAAERGPLLQLAYALVCSGMVMLEPITTARSAAPAAPPETAAAAPAPHSLDADAEAPEAEPTVDHIPAAGPPQPATGGLTKVRQFLAMELERARRLDYFALLEVDRRASPSQIREAFHIMARRYHPDHGTSIGSTQVRQINSELFELICRAHEVLTDDALRAAYIEQLDSGGELPEPPKPTLSPAPRSSPHPPPQPVAKPNASPPLSSPEAKPDASPPLSSPEAKPDASPPLSSPEAKPDASPPKPPPKPEAQAGAKAERALRAEALFAKGAQAMRQKDYRYAKAMLEQAVALCPDEAEYRAELGLALFRSSPDDTAVVRLARDELNQASTQGPNLDKPHLYLGRIYRSMGQPQLCVHELEQALVCNPRCTEAARELRLLRQRRRPKKKGLGGLLDKWKRS